MLKLKLLFPNKKGFTLVELVLNIAVASILIVTLYTCLSFILKVCDKSIEKDEMLLNGRYVSEYIKEEIVCADRIITSSNFPNLDEMFPGNIGFVILNIKRDEYKTEKGYHVYKKLDVHEYSYTTYYFKGPKLIRINAKRGVKDKDILIIQEDIKPFLPHGNEFKGYNEMANKIQDEDEIIYDISGKSKIVLNDDNTVSLDLFFGSDKIENSQFKSNIYLRCEVVR